MAVLPLVEQVLCGSPVHLRCAGRSRVDQADVKVEGFLVRGVVDDDVVVGVKHHGRSGLEDVSHPFGLHRALDVSSEHAVLREELGDLLVLLPGCGGGQRVAVLRLEVSLVFGVLEQVLTEEDDFRVGPRRHADEVAVHLGFLHQGGEDVLLGLVGEEFIDRLDSVFEVRQPDRVQGGDIEGHAARGELAREPVEKPLVGKLNKGGVHAGLGLAGLGDLGQFRLAACLDEDGDRLAGIAGGGGCAAGAAPGRYKRHRGAKAAQGGKTKEFVSSGHRCRLTFSRTEWREGQGEESFCQNDLASPYGLLRDCVKHHFDISLALDGTVSGCVAWRTNRFFE
jgi:hypothetical protein